MIRTVLQFALDLALELYRPIPYAHLAVRNFLDFRVRDIEL